MWLVMFQDLMQLQKSYNYQVNSNKIKYLQYFTFIYKDLPGNYCERVIPDPIPNSEVKPFCANGTLS